MSNPLCERILLRRTAERVTLRRKSKMMGKTMKYAHLAKFVRGLEEMANASQRMA